MSYSQIVENMIQQNREESLEAARLLEPISKNQDQFAYLIQVAGTKYIVIALEGAYYINLQKLIEKFEGKTFDELEWEYLSSKNVKAICSSKAKEIELIVNGTILTVYDLEINPTNLYTVYYL